MTVITQSKEELIRKAVTLIHFSIRSRVAVIGQNRLESMKNNDIGLILMSADTSENTVENISKKFQKEKVIKLKDDTDIGKLIGKEGVKVIGFEKSELQKEIQKLINLYEGI